MAHSHIPVEWLIQLNPPPCFHLPNRLPMKTKLLLKPSVYISLITCILSTLSNLSFGQTLINEHFSTWTSRGSYGNYTQAGSGGTYTMTNMIVAPTGAASGTGSIGYIQMRGNVSTYGTLTLPSVNTAGTVTIQARASSATGPNFKLQKSVSGGAFTDIIAWTVVPSTATTFTFDVNDSNSDVVLRIIGDNIGGSYRAIYLYDIQVDAYATVTTPTVISPTVTGITTTSATLGANVSSDGGASLSARGTVWGTSANPTGNVLAQGVTSTGVYTHSRTGLTANTFYYYRGYATNSAGTAYSADGSFTTLHNAPVVGSGSAATTTTIQANWSAPGGPAGSASFTYEVQVDNDPAFGSIDFSLASISSATTNATATGLTPGITYYYRVRANNATGSSAWSSTSTGYSTVTAPVLNVTTLTAFGAQCIVSNYGPNSFTITGTNLSTANVTVAALAGFSYSTSALGPFTSSLSLSQPGGSYSQVIYVRFSPLAAISYSGNITVGGAGATSLTVAASGSGLNTPPSVSAAAASSITYLSASCPGSISSIGCSAISAYGIEYSTSMGFANGSGTSVASSNLSAGSFSSALSGLSPSTTYYYHAYATNAGGTTYSSELSFTTSALDAPIANAGSSIGDFSFVANWDPVPGVTEYRLDVSTSPFTATLASDLIISEYIEGSASNKYIEVFNGTGAAVNLSDYRLRLYANGATSPTNDVLLSGTLANNSTIVYRNTSATLYGGTSTVNAAVNFNGDDAVALYKISTSSFVDIFGRIGNDPGSAWTLGGNTTVNKTLIRNSDVTGGITVSPTGTGAAAFTTLSTEWNQLNIDDDSDLGMHTFNGSSISYVPGYQDLLVNDISQIVSGLSANTLYYYRVRAVLGAQTSANSNVITVTTTNTACASGVNISSFLPANGPEGTRVTITGTSFLTATAVSFNGIPATYFTIVSDTEIEAQVPETGTGVIRVADSGGCFDISASAFTFISTSGTCTGAKTDLIISEIFDPQSGNDHYIELYNGTNALIDLNGTNDYSLRLLNKSSASDPSPTTYNLDVTGTIAMDGIVVVYAGSDGGKSTLPIQGFNNGFNEFDEIQLLKNGVIIDRIQGPNNVGYDYRRSTSVSGPNSSYTAGEWTIVTTGETDADIGFYSVSTSFEFSLQPLDASAEPCDAISFTIATTGITPTYQWYGLNSSSVWTPMSLTPAVSGITSTTLLIDPALGIDGAQFYCTATQGVCSKKTVAVQFTEIPNTKTYFQSAGSGNYFTGNIWEFSSSATGPWETACFYPTASSSTEIRIKSGHTVTVSGGDITVDQVIVETGGHLILAASDAITLSSGTGVDLLVEGTLTDNATSGSGNGVFALAGATWQLGNAGTLIKTNNSSFAVYRDNYEGGMASIPSTSTIIIRSVAGTNPSYTAVGNTYYPNLIFESTSGNWNPGVVASRFNGASDFPTIKGNLDIGGSGAGTVVIYNQNTNATPITVLGNTIIRTGSSLTNAGTSNGTGFDLKGDLTVNGSLTLASVNLSNFLSLSGSSSQQISGTGTITLQNLRVNNSSLAGIDIQRNLNVLGELRMTQGLLSTNAFTLTLGQSTSATGTLTWTSGRINGSFKRWFAPSVNSGAETGLFPLGNAVYDQFVTVEYTTAPTTGGTITGTFMNEDMAIFGVPTSPIPVPAAGLCSAFEISRLSEEGYWKMDDADGLSGGLYDISFDAEGFSNVVDVCELSAIKRVGAGDWASSGNHLETTGITSRPQVKREGASGWSNWGFGGGSVNPLPINLLSFDADAVSTNLVNLNWVTGSESGNAYFTIERSQDAVEFTEVVRTSAIGNSSLTNYYENFDRNPILGISYYRLKQTDLNGHFTYSEIVPINIKSNIQSRGVFTVSNPMEGLIFVGVRGVDVIESYRLIDLSGRTVLQTSGLREQKSLEIPTSGLARGIYIIEIQLEGSVVSQKLVY